MSERDQATAWLHSGDNETQRAFERRVRLTADHSGLTPWQVMRRFVRGQITLVGDDGQRPALGGLERS